MTRINTFKTAITIMLIFLTVVKISAQKQVGIFYFSNFGHYLYQPQILSPTGDSWIMQQQSPPYSPPGVINFWGKPLYASTHGDGTIKNNYVFYFNGDPNQTNNGLLDYHADLITQASIDFIVLDFTNGALDFPDGPSYISATKALCKRWQERMNAGLPVPKIVFFVKDEIALDIVENTYFNVYRQDMFYNYLGKKLLLTAMPNMNLPQGDPGQPAVPTNGKYANYTARHCWGLDNTGSYWQFKVNSDVPPPPFYYNGQPEQMSVPVATQATYMTTDGINPSAGAKGRVNGDYFVKYMDAAKNANVKFAFIHSWNEWITGNWGTQSSPHFVDQWLQEYSSDIEPMTGGHGSYYYDLMKTKIAEFKGISLNQTPYAGVINLPGIVEAENYDNGGEGIAYHDTNPQNITGAYRNEGVDIESSTEGFYNLCFSDTGEWTEYTVNVTQSGNYAIDTRVASMAGGNFHLEFNGQNVTGSLAAPNTGGWQNWQWVHKEVYLNSGTYVMRFAIDQPGFNTNGFVFTFLNNNNAITSGQTYRLVNRNSNQVLEIGGCNTADGAVAQQWPWLNSACQKWKVEATDSGYYKLTAQHSNKTLDIVGCSNSAGALIQQWPWVDGVCEQWSIEPTDNGFYRIISRASGLALEVRDALTTNGAEVRQWTWNTASCQQWKLEPVSSTAKLTQNLGLSENEKMISDVLLFPNPAVNQVQVLFSQNDEENVTIQIVDMSGKIVQSKNNIKGGQINVDTSNLSSGIYVVKIKSEEKTMTKKLIIKK